MKTILAAIDFSPDSSRVIAEAVVLARAIAARLIVLHVIHPPPVSDVDAGAQMSADYAARASESAAEALAQWQKKLGATAITVQTMHRVGLPGPCIVEYAREIRADFIVLGSHGHGAFYDLIVGRTASAVLRAASCPVVVVPQAKKQARKTKS